MYAVVVAMFGKWFNTSGLAALAFVAVAANGQERQVWLIGGGEPICSSIEPESCRTDAKGNAEKYFATRNAVASKHFRYSPAGLKRLAELPEWFGDQAQQQADLHQLQALAAPSALKLLTEASWHQLLKPLALSEDLLQLYDDVFEIRPSDRQGKTRNAVVYLEGSEVYVQQLFREFVAAAAVNPLRKDRLATPRIVVLTASSNNPYEYVDYYLSLFEAAGADARWLPIEPALTQLSHCTELNARRFQTNGAFDRAARYPELAAYQKPFCEQPDRLLELIDSADGFFINGGDQSLTMRSLQEPNGAFTPAGRRLLDRIIAGVPVAGSSAGNAVQAGNATNTIPMISGGQSSHALQHGALATEPNAPACALHKTCTNDTDPDQLTYRSSGGLQSFTLGISDTHFRERNREGRLLRLLLDTHTDFGFGVDEATVLRAFIQPDGGARLSVLGAGGVWLVDSRNATVRHRKDKWGEENWSASGFTATRMLAGDSANWRAGLQSVSLACPPDSVLKPNEMPDPEVYSSDAMAQWQRLPTEVAVSGCQRADGRWRYAMLPLQLSVKQQLNVTAP